MANIRTIETALELYYDDNGYYPEYLNASRRCNVDLGLSLKPLVSSGYMSSIPSDPFWKGVARGRPLFCHEYIGLGSSEDYGLESAWYCDGNRRTDYQWALLFHLEQSNANYPQATTSGEYNYCVHGDLK